MLELALTTGTTGPVPVVSAYRPTAGIPSYPPTLEDLARSIIPSGNQTSTSPKRSVRARSILIWTVDGNQQIVMTAGKRNQRNMWS